MDNVWPHAAFYLTASVPSFWNWNDNVVTWADGKTIAFVPELTAVLKRLEPDGLPPFGSVLLLLAACRNNWHEPPGREAVVAEVAGPDRGGELLREVFRGLHKVHALPSDLRQSTTAKAELAAMVFSHAKWRLDRDVSRFVLQSLDRNWSDGAAPPTLSVTTTYWFARDLAALQGGLASLDANALRLRLATGLESPPGPAPIEPPPPTGVAWLAWLEQQAEFAGVARLAKRLLAVVHIPRDLQDADDLPVGGVTDISPRGPLDRLLLSELTHDDLTLSLRVAMNEALYYRRESPPKAPPRQRHVLLDCGLRSWGLPRLYGTAVALAIAAHRGTKVEVQTHRASGGALVPVDLGSPDGLRQHLAALDHRLHPGEALPALAELMAEEDEGDAVVVTSAATLADPAFQRALERQLAVTTYLASVARDGRFELLRHSRAGRKSLCTAQIALEEVLKDRPSAAKLRDKSKTPLPAIFHAQPFPLLLSTSVALANSWHVSSFGLLTLARDGRLLRWKTKLRGAQQLATGLPEGRILGLSMPQQGRFPLCMVAGKMSRRGMHAIWIDRDGAVVSRVPLMTTEERIRSVSVDSNYAYVISDDCIEAVNLRTGRASAGRLMRKLEKNTGLYVLEHSRAIDENHWRWSRLTGSETSTDLTPVTAWLSMTENHVMFDVEGVGGPVAVTYTNEIKRTVSGERLRIMTPHNAPSLVAGVSRDGRRFAVVGSLEQRIVDTLTGHTRVTLNAERDLEPEVHEFIQSRALRVRFRGIGIAPEGAVSLISLKGVPWTLYMPSLVFHSGDAPPAFKWHEFETLERDDVRGFTLKRAEFPDGSEALLDSRGLLHLRCADKSVPECTIVLCQGMSAGWCSDGRMWGAEYYRGETPATDVRDISRDILQPFVERLQ